MENLSEFLPLLIPLVIGQFVLLFIALKHVLTHKNYKTGNRTIWIVISLISYVGPILYFLFGKEEE